MFKRKVLYSISLIIHFTIVFGNCNNFATLLSLKDVFLFLNGIQGEQLLNYFLGLQARYLNRQIPYTGILSAFLFPSRDCHG